MSHVISSETGIPVQRFMCLVETDNELIFQVRWRGLPESEDTIEQLQKIEEDVPELLLKLFCCKNAPEDLVTKTRRYFQL